MHTKPRNCHDPPDRREVLHHSVVGVKANLAVASDRRGVLRVAQQPNTHAVSLTRRLYGHVVDVEMVAVRSHDDQAIEAVGAVNDIHDPSCD